MSEVGAERASTPEQVQQLAHMLSQDFGDQRVAWLEARLQGDHDSSLGHVNRLLDRAAAQRNAGIAAGRAGDTTVEREQFEMQHRTEAVMNTMFGQDAVNEARQTRLALGYASSPERLLKFWGPEASGLFTRLTSGLLPVDDGLDRSAAPPTTIQDADTETYKAYLRQKRFVGSNHIAKRTTPGTLHLILDDTVTVPLSNVVSANGFGDWTGGANKKSYTNADGTSQTAPSIDAIMDYAKRQTPLPPLGNELGAYVQPDGNVLFMVQGGNHRVAAAIARGDSEIQASDGIYVHQLTENII